MRLRPTIPLALMLALSGAPALADPVRQEGGQGREGAVVLLPPRGPLTRAERPAWGFPIAPRDEASWPPPQAHRPPPGACPPRPAGQPPLPFRC